MSFFESIISPFIFFIEKVFLFAYHITGNYGIAIILLSFSVSLLLLPVFIYIEKSKKKDDVIKQKMKPLIDEIKRVYKGQERYYYIKTINRQHNYSSLKALLPILSLLIQIPFFIAAYQYLEYFEGLQGVGFGFIKDLSKPDGLFGVVNILPILMTVINLITVYYYTRLGDGSELKQMLVIAIAFLVLLFNLPAGLVLYWTMNNVFSFFRLFITNPEVFKKKQNSISINIKQEILTLLPKLKIGFIVLLAISVFVQFYWAFTHNFDDIYFRIIAAVIFSLVFSLILGIINIYYQRYKYIIFNINVSSNVFYSLIFLTIYFHLASQFYYTGVNNLLGFISIMFLIPTQFISFLYLIRLKQNVFFKIFFKIYYIVVSYQIISLITLIKGDNIIINIAKLKVVFVEGSFSDVLVPGIFLILSLIFVFYRTQNNIVPIVKKQWWIFVLSSIYIYGLTFLWNPLLVFSTSPGSFGFTSFELLKTNSIYFIFFVAGNLFLFYILPSNIKYLISVVFLMIVVVSVINNQIIPIDLGTLQMNKFNKIDSIIKPLYYYLVEASSIILLYFYINKIIKNKSSVVFITLIILNVIVILNTFYKIININEENKKQALVLTNNKDNLNNNFITFSQNKENVLVIVLDMFQGWYLKYILDENKSLNSNFSGFVWYPNTVSITNYTSSSAPSILAGNMYTPEKLNLDTKHTIVEKITKAQEILHNKVEKESYNYISSTIPYSIYDKNKMESYIPFWSKKWDKYKSSLNIGVTKENAYSVLWQNSLFYSLPLFLKPRIYNKGNWLIQKNNVHENNFQAQQYNLLRILPYISTTYSESKKGSFIWLWFNATHFPWDIIDDDGDFISDVAPFENNKWAMLRINDYITWMKKNNVYNNTKIIILSDHGLRDTKITKHEVMIANPYIADKKNNIPNTDLLSFNPLMMVKEVNKNEVLKIDSSFLSNADTYNIIFDDNNPIYNINNRTLSSYLISWKIKPYKYKQYLISRAYNIRTNVYETKNWELINK